MHTVKEKVSNAASSGKAHVDIYKAQAEEQVQKAAARTKEEKEIAHQIRKAKEAQAKMELHQSKAEHAAEKLEAKQSHNIYGHHNQHDHLHQPYGGQINQPILGTQGHHHPVGTTVPATVPTNPLGGQPAPYGHNKHMHM